MGRADGAHVAPRRAKLWRHRPGAVGPAAAPLASAGPDAGIGGVLAVTLVPTPWLVLAPAAFAQADPRPRSSRPGAAAVLWISMTAAHGSVALPRDSPGGTGDRSPRALSKTGKQTVARKYTSRNELDREGNCLRQAWPRRRTIGKQTVVGQSIPPFTEPDREGNCLRQARPRRR